ncbi:hypothetical protein [Streptomyces parvus]|uniref:hypothetical protein n=1 Tax=Streptomyces parvus TaxID=66428 RepID=UPI00331F7C63
MSSPERPKPLADSNECRRAAEEALRNGQDPLTACVWALLAIAGDLAAIRRAGK